MVLVLVVFISCFKTEIPDTIGDWSVEVGPPGNEFYQPPKPPSKVKPLAEYLLDIVGKLAPDDMEISGWVHISENLYMIRTESETERYSFLLFDDGGIYAIWYENESTHREEAASELVLKGTKKRISLDKVPSHLLKTLSTVFPNSSFNQVWIASTIAGTRYVIVMDEMVFYARPDGQIQAAGLIENGALFEIEAYDQYTNRTDEEILSEARKILGRYRERFNLDNQLKRLGKNPKSRDGHFRFVVTGDSRSNPDLWPNIINHINSLKPKPDFIINTGDIVNIGLAKEYDEYFIPPLLKMDVPFFIAIGNHDYGTNGKAIEYCYLSGENALNYFFDYGNIRFILLDNVTRIQTPQQTRDWLNEVLLTTPKDYQIIVAAHKPVGNVEKWAYHAMEKDNSEEFTELMSRYQVDHVFFGHIHTYSTTTLNNVDYTITGGGGAPLAHRFGPLGNVHHYVICDVLPDGFLKQQVVRFYKRK